MADRWRSILAAGLALAVAGCVSMPGSGPAVKYPAESGTGQNQVYIVPHPEPPGLNWTPEDIVRGFLAASAYYATDDRPARAYLTDAASQDWNPKSEPATVFAQVSPTIATKTDGQATVSVDGDVLVSLTGTGSVATQSTAQSHPPYDFNLVKVGGQWRIDKPPRALVMAKEDFTFAYQAQNVYYVSAGQSQPTGQSQASRLVPDTVYVPLGTSEDDLVTRLVDTILAPPKDWLQNAAQTSLQNTRLVSATVSYPTAVINLTGAIARATPPLQQQMAAQLAYTLVGSPTAQGAITAVKMEINGNPSAATGGQTPVPLSDARYQPYDPYPAPSQGAPFTYVDPHSHAAQSWCGSVQSASITGHAVAVFGPSGPQLASCQPAAASASASPPAGKHAVKTVAHPSAMVLPSPDGKEIAAVSADTNQVTIWPLGARPPAATVRVPGVLSASWDQMHELWIVTPDGDVDVLTAAGKLVPAEVYPGLTQLAIAPDGVRVAMVVNGALQLAAIVPSQSAGSQITHPGQSPWVVGVGVPVSSSVTQVKSMSWYDRDNLVVVSGASGTEEVEEVPVNGGVVNQAPRRAGFSVPAGRYPVAIAADSAANVLVITLDNDQLEVASGIDGPAQLLGQTVLGDAPAYGMPGAVNP